MIQMELPGFPPSSILLKVLRDTYHVRAIAEVLGEKRKHVPHTEWTAAESVAISARQAEMRRELGL